MPLIPMHKLNPIGSYTYYQTGCRNQSQARDCATCKAYVHPHSEMVNPKHLHAEYKNASVSCTPPQLPSQSRVQSPRSTSTPLRILNIDSAHSHLVDYEEPRE